MKYKWLLFDLDNTLFDFNKAELFAFQSVLSEFKIEYSEELYHLYHAISKTCWQALEKGKITQDELRSLRMKLFLEEINVIADPVAFGETYLDYLSSKVFYVKHAEKIITDLKDRHNIVVITNGIKDVQRRRLSHSPLTEFFHSIVISDEIGVAKPQKDYFDHTFEQMNHPSKEEVLVIGDNLHSDIVGGLNYGLKTCWFNPNALNSNGILPDYDIKNLNELYDIV